MILSFGAVSVPWRPCSRMKTAVCSTSLSVTADQLRLQLDSLHKEADDTRARSSNARLRLLRLSEAVENIRRQAAVNAQTGKDDDARELLFQKKKVMQAMEKLKTRIELFDELSAKLNEAISVKESLLLGNMALNLDVTETEAPSPIRIVSPTEENSNTSDDEHNIGLNNLESGEDDQEFLFRSKSEVDSYSENELKGEECFEDQRLSSADNGQVLREIATYNDFIMNIDQQLNKIEEEIEIFLRYSNMLLGNEKQEYSKVHHVTEILAGVGHIRERIARIRQTK